MPKNDRAITGSQQQQEPLKVAADPTACIFDGHVETSFRTADAQDLVLTYSDASTLSKGDPFSLSWAVFHSSLETTPETAAVIDRHTIIHNPNFDAHIFKIHVKSIACCQKLSDRIIEKNKQ